MTTAADPAPQYKIDADMLDSDFTGTCADLHEFLPLLAEATDSTVDCFVVQQHVSQEPGSVEPTEREWREALEAFRELRPELFE